MTPVRLRRRVLVAILALHLTACAAGADGGSEPAAAPTADAPDDPGPSDHGAVDGAEEVAEAQLALVTITSEGTVDQLDLLDGSIEELGQVPAPDRVHSDGRFVFADDGAGVTVVDSGRWTWDHGDHFHHYRAAPRILERVEGSGPATIATTNRSTTGGTGLFFAETGTAVLLDTAALADGEVVERWRRDVEPHDGMVVPVGSSTLLTSVDGGRVTSLVAVDADGMPSNDTANDGTAIDCPDARGTITTRVGAVVGCADGAVLATTGEAGLRLEHVPYPPDATAPAAVSFDNREGRPTVAGLAADEGIWLLDTRERTWTLLPAPAPLVHVTAVDDADGHVLALTDDGRVLVLEAETGDQLASTEPLVDVPADPAGVTLLADRQRAYLHAARSGRVVEIDFADDARVARTFDIGGEQSLLAGTGR